jgi:hypothetical protein
MRAPSLGRLQTRILERARTGATSSGACEPSASLRVVVLIVLGLVVLAPSAQARPYDPAQPWFVEAMVGAVRPGPDGTDFGAGQNYAVHLGYQRASWLDIGLSLAWAQTRSNELAIESDVTSGGARVRGWIGRGRWTPYGELGLRVYRFNVSQNDVNAPFDEASIHFGGEAGLGVLYSRSTWWAGIGAELHGAIGSVSIEGGDLLTFLTYNVIVGAPLPR